MNPSPWPPDRTFRTDTFPDRTTARTTLRHRRSGLRCHRRPVPDPRSADSEDTAA
jgi:hypothetical protein